MQATATFLDRRDEIEQPPHQERFSTLQRLASDPEKRFVISLGGGCVPALCGNAALVALLEELGLRQHVAEVWGTSSGAIIGGAWASGLSSETVVERVRALSRRRMLDVAWLRVALGFLLQPFGGRAPDALIGGRHFYREIAAALAVDTFEECAIPFRCIACAETPNFRLKVFRDGPLAPAISASISLPGLLLPRDENGRVSNGFFDGGLVEKTPLFSPIADHMRLGDGRGLVLLGTHFGPEGRLTSVPHGFINRFLLTIDSLEERLWKYQQQEASGQAGVSVLMLNPRIDDPCSFEFSHIEADYLQARETFMDQLQNGKIAMALGGS